MDWQVLIHYEVDNELVEAADIHMTQVDNSVPVLNTDVHIEHGELYGCKKRFF